LLRLLLGPRVADVDVDDAAAALSLHWRAREAALLRLAHGPRLLAAIELGRRAWMTTPPIGTRLHGPADVAAVAAPRLVDDERRLVLCLDVRGRVARMTLVADDDDDEVTALQEILVAGCRRGIVCRRVSGPALASEHEVARVTRLKRCGAMVGVDVVDGVLLGDDGFCSLLRLGLIGVAPDRRYS
jgi:DNA repair protein RadC